MAEADLENRLRDLRALRKRVDHLLELHQRLAEVALAEIRLAGQECLLGVEGLELRRQLRALARSCVLGFSELVELTAKAGNLRLASGALGACTRACPEQQRDGGDQEHARHARSPCHA